MSSKKSFFHKMLPIEFQSISGSTVAAIKEFGIFNFVKIVYFVLYRTIKYKIKLSLLPKKDFLEREVMGNQMILDRKNGGISWDLLVNGIREENSTHFFRDELKPGMNILEVGANIGYYLLQEVDLIGKDGHVYAFEPDPNNHDLLEKNIALNNAQNVTLHKMALGNKKQKIDFFVAERGNLSSFVIETDNRVPVDMDRGEDVLPSTRIDYVRMDVEGFELDILKGIEGLLTDSVQGLFIEVHPVYLKRLGTSMEEFFAWLNDHNFYLVKCYCDYDWSDASFDNERDLLQYKYAQKMVWRSFFRKK